MTLARTVSLLSAAGTLLLVACGDEPDWHTLGAGDLDARQSRQAVRAEGARDALFTRLGARLAEAVTAGGPALAITVCRDDAPRIAAEVGKEHGVKIGRTSHRLRNPANAPPTWARALVGERVDQPRYLAHADGRLAALLPIRLQKRCMTCHGEGDAIPPPVREALAATYPADAATGFAEGELRGWFWLEVPAP